MDETLVPAGWARSRICAARESAALYRVFPIVPVLQYRYLYSTTSTYSTGIAVPVPAAGAVGCDSCFTLSLFLLFILSPEPFVPCEFCKIMHRHGGNAPQTH